MTLYRYAFIVLFFLFSFSLLSAEARKVKQDPEIVQEKDFSLYIERSKCSMLQATLNPQYSWAMSLSDWKEYYSPASIKMDGSRNFFIYGIERTLDNSNFKGAYTSSFLTAALLAIDLLFDFPHSNSFFQRENLNPYDTRTGRTYFTP